MLQGPNKQVNFYIVPQTWYGRLLTAVVGAVLFILLIFFFTFFSLYIFFALLSHFPLKVIQKDRKISLMSRKKDWFLMYS